jgi:arginyl-tRNA synthetase
MPNAPLGGNGSAHVFDVMPAYPGTVRTDRLKTFVMPLIFLYCPCRPQPFILTKTIEVVKNSRAVKRLCGRHFLYKDNCVLIMKQKIRTILAGVFEKCRAEGLFTGTLPDFVVEAPRSREHGDLAVNIAMMLAKSEKKQPRQIAELLVEKLAGSDPVIEKLEIAGPGFINFYLKQDAWHSALGEIETQGPRFGSCTVGQGRRVMVEFVSANPTGPLHIGHGRGAALGDALARIMAFAGFAVVREYYINDIGNQMQNLGRSLYLRYQQLLKKDVEFP